jgi:sugar-specific transcriptional regulator TrmB
MISTLMKLGLSEKKAKVYLATLEIIENNCENC